MRGGGALTLTLFDVDLASLGCVVSVEVHALLKVQVAGLCTVDVTNMLIESVGFNQESLTSTNHERQSAASLWAPAVHSKVML